MMGVKLQDLDELECEMEVAGKSLGCAIKLAKMFANEPTESGLDCGMTQVWIHLRKASKCLSDALHWFDKALEVK